jgi:Na+-driven multidrug efflux pump
VPGLILLLPRLGAMGAALVSLIAYTTTFSILVAVATRHFGHRVRDYLLPRRDDLDALRAIALSVAARLRRRTA